MFDEIKNLLENRLKHTFQIGAYISMQLDRSHKAYLVTVIKPFLIPCSTESGTP